MSTLSNKYRKRKQSNLFIKLFCVVSTFVVMLIFMALYKYLDLKVNGDKNTGLPMETYKTQPQFRFHSRKLLNASTTPLPMTEPDIGDYPKDLFTLEEKKDGWIVMHVIGVLYLFLALAIICDEFFVPALHVISSILKISDDVAGATFMAAGGSAPELFTSIIGVFFSKSQVGFGTIVGSAVFNVLFVIGMCAIFSKTLLELTWWPLLRDSLFYIVALVLLIIFFSDSAISWHESLGLFLVYVVYVIFMTKNGDIEIAVKSYISKKTRASSVTPIIDEKNGQGFLSFPMVFSKNAFRNGALQLVIHTLDPIAEAGVDDKFQKMKDQFDTVSTQKDASSLLDDNLLDGQVMSPNHSQTTMLQDDFNRHRSASSFLRQNKKDDNGIELHNTSYNNHHNSSEETINGAIPHQNSTEIDSNHHEYPINTSSRPSSAASFGPEVDVNQNQPYGEHDHKHNHEHHHDPVVMSSRSSVRFSSRRLSRCSSRASCRSHRGLAPIKKESPVDDMKDLEGDDEEGEEEEGPVDLSWPDENFERVYYVIKAPIVFLLVLTVPDVRRPKLRKLFPLTFIMSIFWIAVFSYLMLWWASEIGRAAGIDVEIMGLTFIAAGTSIPDLITSVVVARQGLGDMAVSSSIGSNIFDVTIGLPLPWLAYSISKDFKDVIVVNSGLFCSTILLFMMLVAVIITIALSKWKMTKLLGLIMFGLYIVFITLTLLLQLGIFNCPF